jgi:hypothetical protein
MVCSASLNHTIHCMLCEPLFADIALRYSPPGMQEAAQQAHALALAEARVGCRWWELLRMVNSGKQQQQHVPGWQGDTEWASAMVQLHKQRGLMLQQVQTIRL